MSILIIDKSEEMRADVAFFLSLAGHRSVAAVSSFSEGLAILSAQEGEDKPDAMATTNGGEESVELILIGAGVEDIDLVTACQILSSSPQWQLVPVLLLVRQEISTSEVEAALTAGAFDFVNIPISPTELSARTKSAERYRLALEHRRTAERELIEVSTQLQLSNRRVAEANDELRRTSDKDLLTGIYNKRWFDERLGLELRSASRRNVPLSLLLLDLDHFSLFNESYGRAIGDECLASVAAAIKRALKRSIDSAARVGGEEFAVLLPDTTAQGAVVVATKILALVRGLNIPHEKSPAAGCVTASIGIDTRIPMPRLTNSTIILAANRQLHQAKKLGRNRLSIAESALGRQASAEDKFFKDAT